MNLVSGSVALACDGVKMVEGPASTPKRSPVDVFRFLDYRAYLAEYYRTRKARGFSYRAFSRMAKLGAPNYLKLVIDGQRNLTPAMAERFAKACGLRGDGADYFKELVAFNQAPDAEQRNASYTRLTGYRRYRRSQKLEIAQAAYHSTWYLPAIRELSMTADFREDPEWIAATLCPPIRPVEARQAIDTLLELGLIERDTKGKLAPHAAVVSTGPETQGMHIGNYHREMMQRAAASIELVAAEQRDISSLTLALGPKGLKTVKERLQSLRKELLQLSESERKTSQVVQLNLQLFPLSQPGPPAKKRPKEKRDAQKS